MTDEKARRRLITLGELIALAALIVSGLGVWIAWKSNNGDRPARVVEQRPSVPLALRGTTESDGRVLAIVPADPAHALESLRVTFRNSSPLDIGSDGRLAASDVQAALNNRDKEPKDVAQRIEARIDARYVEAGTDRRGGGTYVLRYKWEGGGLFGGRSLRFLGLSRA